MISSSSHHQHSRFIGAVEDEWQLYSDRSSDYTIGAPIGFGASSIVYAAQYHPPAPNPQSPAPPPMACALKVLDLDSLPPHSLSLLQRETVLMSLSKHPNVLRVRGSWIDGHKLYIALRLMNKGSAADVMRYGWPGGMEEDVVRCILTQALQGLNYLHINGFIHRDVKAANLLIDDDGTVLLGDLGVAANLAEESSETRNRSRTVMSAISNSSTSTHSSTQGGKRMIIRDSALKPRMGKRKSFVGTPCWMAPELIQGRQYDAAADIWSFGITALELCQGRPPRSRENPQKVLMKIIQEDPPTLDRDNGTHKYSRAFKEMIDSCLVKDPSQRPTAEQLLQSPFFKAAKRKHYLVGAILKDLPPLANRQERRRNPSYLTQSQRSVDSWDFASTIGASSLHRRRGLEDPDLGEERRSSLAAEDPVFEMEGEWTSEDEAADPPNGSVFALSSSSSAPSSPSLSADTMSSATDSPPSTPGPHLRVGKDGGFPFNRSAEGDLELPPAALQPQSVPERSRRVAPAPAAMADRTASSHSERVSSSLPHYSPDIPNARPKSLPHPPPLLRRSTDPSLPPSPTMTTVTKRDPMDPAEHPHPPHLPRTRSAFPTHQASPSHTPSLWRKLTHRASTHLKQPPSPRGVATRRSDEKLKDVETLDGERHTGKSKMGSLLARKAGAGKDALVRTTSRTAQAVGFTMQK